MFITGVAWSASAPTPLVGTPMPGDAAPVPSASPVQGPSPSPVARIALALDTGVLIVVSKRSQRMQVFRDGQPWLATPVSTGRRGHGTPSGVFPILEKRRFHRSNLYSNAPMPFMQRLTRGGIAIHAGHLPGYPASHGCIRVPSAVARELFAITDTQDTIVVIVNQRMQSADDARRLALGWPPAPNPSQVQPLAQPRLAFAPGVGTETPGWQAHQTIQLAAASSREEAEGHWRRLLGRHPELARFSKLVLPVDIGPRRLFRLRVSGAGAHASCSQLKANGTDCFKVL